jgi:hypothetical protein
MIHALLQTFLTSITITRTLKSPQHVFNYDGFDETSISADHFTQHILNCKGFNGTSVSADHFTQHILNHNGFNVTSVSAYHFKEISVSMKH